MQRSIFDEIRSVWKANEILPREFTRDGMLLKGAMKQEEVRLTKLNEFC